MQFDPTLLREATKGFDQSCLLGVGGCGAVYLGKIFHTQHSYTQVAIKKLISNGFADATFMEKEVEALTK